MICPFCGFAGAMIATAKCWDCKGPLILCPVCSQYSCPLTSLGVLEDFNRVVHVLEKESNPMEYLWHKAGLSDAMVELRDCGLACPLDCDKRCPDIDDCAFRFESSIGGIRECRRILRLAGLWARGGVLAAMSEPSTELGKELKALLTNGWSESERSDWGRYLETEVKPYWPLAFSFLKAATES
jgi:hypothetical protein